MHETAIAQQTAVAQKAQAEQTQGRSVRIGEVDLYVEETGAGSLALVFIHYWGGSRRSWSDVISRLSDRFRCVAIDLRGWGRSDHNAADYSIESQAADVEGLIESLKLKDFVLVAHSSGGKIAQIVAGRQPAGLRALVLLAPAPPTPLPYSDEQKQAMLVSYTTPEGVENALKVISERPLTLEQRLQVTEDSLGGALGAKTAWVAQGMALDISARTVRITVPVFVLEGTADRVIPEALLRSALLPLLPQAQFKTIDGVGHLSPLEAPADVANAIAQFLATQKSPAAA